MKGTVVVFTKITAKAAATTPLSETTEPTPGNISDTQPSVTLAEYGDGVKQTIKLRKTSFLNIDLAIPREIASQMEETVDILARNVLVAGTAVQYAGAATSRVTVAATHLITGNEVREARANLAALNIPQNAGNLYEGYIHPFVSYDLQAETGQAGWQAPHVYSDPAGIYSGEIGSFSGVRFIENANSRNFADAGVGGTVDVYATLFMGQQALGEAVGVGQHMVMSGPFDDLQRFFFLGWYALMGWGIIRQESLRRLESASSIGAN
jgi:N4-gp56 family major capsid protein